VQKVYKFNERKAQVNVSSLVRGMRGYLAKPA